MSITRTEALTLLGAGTQPGPLAFARLINELFDRIEALEAADTAILAGTGFTLPETDPEVLGSLYSAAGTVTVSEGPAE